MQWQAQRRAVQGQGWQCVGGALALDFLTLDSWVTSDHHWGHDNIKKFQGRPDDHFELMVEQWHDTVSRGDIVLHLGDLVCYDHRRPEPERFWKALVRDLPGIKFIILGNHDKKKPEWYEQAGFVVLGRGDKAFMWHDPRNGKPVAFSHEPIMPNGWGLNVHGHVHGNGHRPLEGRLSDRINVCVEVTNYAPVKVGDILSL
jgi:calcineurin-like phosphoesterase family protein